MSRVWCFQHLCSPGFILTASDFLFCYLFSLGNGLSSYVLSSCQIISLGVHCYELAHASAKLVDCQATAYLVVCGVHHTDPLVGLCFDF